MDFTRDYFLSLPLDGWQVAQPLTSEVTNTPRILYVHNSADIYGASRSLLRLLPRIKARGYELSVVLPQDGPLRGRIEALGLGTRVALNAGLSVIDRAAFKSPFGLAHFLFGFPLSVARLRRIIAQDRVSLAHTNTGVMPSVALAARMAGVPHVWHVRDSFQEFRSLWSWYRRYITALSRTVICVSNPIAAQFNGAANVRVIHNGLPLDEFPDNTERQRAEFRAKYQLGDHAVVGCVGRIKFVRKGQEVLVEAMVQLKRRRLKAKCLIVGTTSAGNEDHWARLLNLARDLGLKCIHAHGSESGLAEADVLLTGELADPRPAYAGLDVLVLPSAQPEPFGGVVLEAMAARRPVIATAIGGSLDQVVDGETGFLVPPGDAGALAEKLAVLIRDPARCRTMGDAGRNRLEQCFSLETMVEKIEKVYRESMERI